MKTRYHRQAQRAGAIALLSGVICSITASAMVVNGLAGRPGAAIALAMGTALLGFIAIIEAKESMRCLRLAAQWDYWDRRDLPPSDTRRP